MSNSNNNNDSNLFSKNDFASLFSTDVLTSRTSTNNDTTNNKKSIHHQSDPSVTKTDISHLGSSETVRLLRQSQQSQIEKISEKNKTRYRAKSSSRHNNRQADVLAGITAAVQEADLGLDLHHEEGSKNEYLAKTRQDESIDEDEEEENNFVERKREKIQPQVLHRQRQRSIDSDEDAASQSSQSEKGSKRQRIHSERGRRRRRRNESDSENSASTSGSSSSSDSSSGESEDEEDVDARRSRLRARVLATRKPTSPERDESDITKDVANSHKSTLTQKLSSETEKGNVAIISREKTKKLPLSGASSESSSSSGSELSSEDESFSEDNSDSDGPAIAKPLFVPRSKRGLVKDADTRFQEEEQQIQKTKELKEKRTLQSRSLLAQVLANEAKDASNDLLENNDLEDEEGGGSQMPPPPDDDYDSDDLQEASRQRDAWQVRELLRILETYDKLEVEEMEKKELEFRRGLSDREIMEMEGRSRGDKFVKTHLKRKDNHMQRFYHRGAFYMDEDTLKKDPNDIRNKAKEYARAATGEDKIDKRNLPKIMQVKNFGMAGYSTKYKGLKHEDTTEKGRNFLPIKRHKRK